MKGILALLLLFSFSAGAQKILKGQVVDQNNRPIADASVFASNTSYGTRTDAQGRFEFYLPSGRYELIVSSIGYNTYTKSVNSAELENLLIIQLSIKTNTLDTVVIEPFEKNGWERWGKFFVESFIGTSLEASHCKIKNHNVIRFRYSKKNATLSAFADEPLIIENDYLGYTVTYQLENFSYHFNHRYLLFIGYPFFQEWKGNKAKQRKWVANRRQAYEGSVMHFMRALYVNKIAEEGFEVRRLVKKPNLEKTRIRQLMASQVKRTPGGTLISPGFEADSSGYYERILKQPDYFDIIGKELLTGDSIAYAIDSVTAGMDFDNYLLVIYKNRLAPREYVRQFPESGTRMISQITLINDREIAVMANGNYFSPEDLVSQGYWAWSEKIASMLPFDYRP